LAIGQPFKEHKMKHKDAFFGISSEDQSVCNCGMFGPNTIDWATLTNTEKMVKAMLLKAQITGELHGPLDILAS
jgi:hypothetical protein